VATVVGDITGFIVENWVQWQDWILARLQQAAGLPAVDPEDVEPEFDFKSKEMLQINWWLDNREMMRNLRFRPFEWFDDMLRTRTKCKVHIPAELSKLQTVGAFMAACSKNEKGKGKDKTRGRQVDRQQSKQWPGHQWHGHQWHEQGWQTHWK